MTAVWSRNLERLTGRTVTEEKEVKERWKEYTEKLYRKNPGISNVFTEKVFDDKPDILEAEVKQAISQLANWKAAGCDGIPVELLKAVGDDAIKVLTRTCNSIWKNKWPKDWKKSVYMPIYKKGDKKECGNYRTIALIPHASKVMLKKDWKVTLSPTYQRNRPALEGAGELETT